MSEISLEVINYYLYFNQYNIFIKGCMTLGTLVAAEKLKGVGARSALPTVEKICKILNLSNQNNNQNNNIDNNMNKNKLDSNELK